MTKLGAWVAVLALMIGGGNVASAQAWQAPPLPTSRAAVGQWSAAIVSRASQLIKTAAQWNRADSGMCATVTQTYSIGCALQKAIEEGAGIHREHGPGVAGSDKSPPATCLFHPAGAGWEGSCGTFRGEIPIFTIARAEKITSGAWRTDIHPQDVWSGRRVDAQSPLQDEADSLVAVVSKKKFVEPLDGYNNDPATTVADVQRFFQLLRDRVAAHASADLDQSGDPVEIEIYPGGTGVMRIYAGWYAVSGFMSDAKGLRFQVDSVNRIPPSALDRQILQRAAQIIAADSVWNRADNRKCAATAKTWSIYCAIEQAEAELAGGSHHRRPAMELVRAIVDERTTAKPYHHRLMDYNNDPATRLDDVRTLFAEAINRIKR